MEPVSIGTTPLDGIWTFLDAHDADSADDAETIFGQGAHDVVESIVDMASLLYAQDDTYDSKIRAQDILYTNNFASNSGGNEWHFDGKTSSDKPPLMPNDAQRKTLALLNEQSKLDAANEKLRDTRWELFSEWWQFLSNRANDQNSVISDAKNRVATLKRKAVTLERLVNTITQSINQPGQHSKTKCPANKPPKHHSTSGKIRPCASLGWTPGSRQTSWTYSQSVMRSRSRCPTTSSFRLPKTLWVRLSIPCQTSCSRRVRRYWPNSSTTLL